MGCVIGYVIRYVVVLIVEMPGRARHVLMVIGRDVEIDRYDARSVIGGIDRFTQTAMVRITNPVVRIVRGVDGESAARDIVVENCSLSLIVGELGVNRSRKINKERLISLKGRVFTNRHRYLLRIFTRQESKRACLGLIVIGAGRTWVCVAYRRSVGRRKVNRRIHSGASRLGDGESHCRVR